ncbi:MAG TPA: glycoside hydrolase family 97 N-terminal domain-containing protein [Blastocatellia bacterium]|nr:glycoside hydrolase family 97 N-terminal domain-containing protein [Blastocatellia bacterium]
MKPVIVLLFAGLLSLNAYGQNIESPGKKLSLTFALTPDGEPTYQLSFKGKPVIQKTKLGLELKDQPAFASGFTVVKSSDEWTRPTAS